MKQYIRRIEWVYTGAIFLPAGNFKEYCLHGPAECSGKYEAKHPFGVYYVDEKKGYISFSGEGWDEEVAPGTARMWCEKDYYSKVSACLMDGPTDAHYRAIAILRCGRSYDEASKVSGIPVADIMEAYQKASPK